MNIMGPLYPAAKLSAKSLFFVNNPRESQPEGFRAFLSTPAIVQLHYISRKLFYLATARVWLPEGSTEQQHETTAGDSIFSLRYL